MAPKIIRLCYRKIIDINVTDKWSKLVFDSSYAEFLLQFQLYNQQKKYIRFSELNTDNAISNKINFLVSASVLGYLQQLNGIIPDITNNLGKLLLPFKGYKFEIIESDISNKRNHKIVINFFSEPITWIDTVNNYLLIAVGNQKQVLQNSTELETSLVPLIPYLSIFSIFEN